MTEDPIRDLLSGVDASPFIWTWPGHVAILQSRVVEAGGDPDAVRRWVEERGGYVDRTSPVGVRTHGTPYRPKPPGKPFYAVPVEALESNAEPG